MKFIHTFWSKPLLANKFNKLEILLPVIINQYAYSAECIHNLGYKIILFTDTIGAELLSCIPYDDIILVPNLESESIHFAAQLKFYALQHSELGDCLIDGDLFIRKSTIVPKLYQKVDCIYCLFEPHVYTVPTKTEERYYLDLLHEMKSDYESPYLLPERNEDLEWVNTSLIIFNNQELKDEYIRQYYHHKNQLKSVQFSTWPDIILEQRFLTLLLKQGKYTHAPIIENFYIDLNSNKKAYDDGFTHLGSGKICWNDWIKQLFSETNKQLYDETVNHINKMIYKYIKSNQK